ncbi:hypothetical protein C7B62_12525 [Pleurocapsa sp. CCALA 161]|uniref:DUF1517 domain-containing protein n=1 Tax=Pleurocapsa sp. CCALA 161 TaxID=2107688 RepID=UPI000D062427|nr:DUF1517 domain-containing protein [Pleurocapsa sp. CCALA 161]PSB09607.1 hypothetical protein C7B62_12525 [Pleurocapsa sp. CCALA 161]
MFKYNFNPANLRLLIATLLATTTYSLGPTKIESTLANTFDDRLSLLESKSTHQDAHKNIRVTFSIKQQSELYVLSNNSNNSDQTKLAASNSDEKTTQAKLVRLISLSLFMLFFVPLGIFYPLFLFYRMLLIKPDEPDDILNSDRQQELADSNPIDSILQAEQDVNQATVSKLQIAFSPPATRLREELNRITLMSVEVEHDVVDLMHQTVRVLIEQGHWTHASYTSATLPLHKVRPEFDFITAQEKTRCDRKTPSLVNQNRNFNNSDALESYSYVVVTLILCTSKAVVSKTINTKEQLVKELNQLGKLEKNLVIKYELFWNPQQEGVYLSNAQLLTEYTEMTRLL